MDSHDDIGVLHAFELKKMSEKGCVMKMAEKKKINPKEIFCNPIQVGVLVKDLEGYLQKLNDVFGMGPFRIAEYPPENEILVREYHGRNGNFKAKFCFYDLGNIELELIQPLEGESIWEDFLREHGPGIHHLKFLVPEHEQVREYLNEKGYDIYQQGGAVGPNKGRCWAFYPTYGDIGFDVEIMNR